MIIEGLLKSRNRKMFGTVVCNKKALTDEEAGRYRSVYCGLCRALRTRYGQIERMTLNYDMTFLALLLNGLYEENNDSEEIRCPMHPLKKERVIRNRYIDYAADMTILLAYYKCIDDWQDEKKVSGMLYGKLLQKDMERIKREYPRQEKCVRKSLQRLGEIEKSHTSLPDEAVNYSGLMLSEIFVYKEDFWADSLRKLGYELGRFIYLMDAALDYEKDKKDNNYNPLFHMSKKPIEIEDILMQSIGNAAMQFEKLPIEQDINIMRNIIYSGVWLRYNGSVKGKEEKHHGE